MIQENLFDVQDALADGQLVDEVEVMLERKLQNVAMVFVVECVVAWQA